MPSWQARVLSLAVSSLVRRRDWGPERTLARRARRLFGAPRPYAVMASISMMLGLMRWPSIHWRLAEAYAVADPSQRAVLAALFDGLNSYLGNYLGEFLGELSFSMFFLLSAWAMRKSPVAPRWAAPIGLITGAAGLIGMFRNMTSSVATLASINNYLLPSG